MPIKTIRDSSSNLTEHIASGAITESDMFECQKQFYEQAPTLLQLWDMREAGLEGITTEGLREFVENAARLGEIRRGGKTGVIVQTALQYGFSRMAGILGDSLSLPFEFRTFTNRDEALAWLGLPATRARHAEA
jgi:hypothetical protein